jgi:PEP-CTERM motif
MTELIVAARFDMYGVSFSQPDILDWQMEYGRDNENYAVELWMQQSNGNSIYWGAGDEEYSLQVELDGHFGSHSLGYCYASDPDGMWTEDLCYDMDIRAVASTVPEPGTLALLGLGLGGIGFVWRRSAAAGTRPTGSSMYGNSGDHHRKYAVS